MGWVIEFHEEFDPEFEDLAAEVQDELLAQARVIEQFGPQAGRPRVDTLNGSDFANMKELRFDAADGVWRVAFALDPKQHAVLLVAGDKSGVGEKKFYRHLIDKADARYKRHVQKLKEAAKKAKEAEKKAKGAKKR